MDAKVIVRLPGCASGIYAQRQISVSYSPLGLVYYQRRECNPSNFHGSRCLKYGHNSSDNLLKKCSRLTFRLNASSDVFVCFIFKEKVQKNESAYRANYLLMRMLTLSLIRTYPNSEFCNVFTTCL